MQIFVLDRDPAEAARALADTHVVKMCLETAQILSTILSIKGSDPDKSLPKAYNTNHPVIIAVDTPAKLNWLLEYNYALHTEFYHRFGKCHKYAKLYPKYEALLHTYGVEPDCEGMARVFTNFTTQAQDLVEANRDYYRYKKTVIKRWTYTKSQEPEWLSNQ